MDTMVLATDEQGFVVMANASANKLILGEVDNITHIKLATLAIGAEMNNSLTPIVAISQSMQKKLQRKDTQIDTVSLFEGINIINERADSLSQFIASYSQLSQLPKPNKSAFKLAIMIEKLAILYPECKIHCQLDAELLISADKSQLEQVLINLFKNSAEAMHHSDEKTITIHSSQESNWQHTTIRDFGTGIANLTNVFVHFTLQNLMVVALV